MTVCYCNSCNNQYEDIIMNIFVLSYSPVKAAQYQCDKHVVKMCLESVQLLCTVLRLKGYNSDKLYKMTHKNHPTTLSLLDNRTNLSWLLAHTAALFREYTYRYGKVHKSNDIFIECLRMLPSDIVRDKPFSIAKVTNNDKQDIVESYREYYKSKRGIMDMRWTGRSIPEWLLYEIN